MLSNKRVIYDENLKILDIIDGKIIDMNTVVKIKRIKNTKKPKK